MDVASLKIGIFHQALGRHGGAERLCLNVARQLLGRGHRVTLYWHDWDMQDANDALPAQYDDLKKYIVVVPWEMYRLGHVIESMKKEEVICVMYHVNPLVGSRITQAVRGKVPLIWYAGEPNRGLWERWITGTRNLNAMRKLFHSTVSRIYGRYIGMVASFVPIEKVAKWFLRGLDREYVERFDFILSQSKATAYVLRYIFSIPMGKIIVVYPGVDFTRFHRDLNDVREEVLNLSKEKYLLSVGALEEHKNYQTMFVAFTRAIKKIGLQNVKLIVVGDGTLYSLLIKIASQIRNIDIKIFRRVNTAELKLLYDNCIGLIHCAFWEPFGLTPIEAALFQKPAIVSAMGGPSETITKESGIHINPYDIKDISSAIQKLLKDEEKNYKMGVAARQNALEKFTIEKMMKHLENVFQRIIKGSYKKGL